MQKTFSPMQIEELVPHRYENLVVDHVDLAVSDSAVEGFLELCVAQNDALGRDIFFKQKRYGHFVMMSPILMEVLALGSIVCSDKMAPGNLVFFAGISQFVKHQDLGLSQPFKGQVKKVKDKAGFLVCDAKGFVQDTLITEAQLMAFFPDPAMVAAAPKSPKKQVQFALTQHMSFFLPKQPSLKHPLMYVVDELMDDNTYEKTALARYKFPAHHPLVKGHFPGNPVLMGVMQWMMVEDAVLALLLHRKGASEASSARFKVSGNAELAKKDLTSVAEIKGFSVEAVLGHAQCPDQAELVKTDKVTFRDRVSPEEDVYIRLSDLVIEPL
jgi:3-hydroxymyristoyl/3-hydroxydecanoyl-(acyl carrier protein) dehydratase